LKNGDQIEILTSSKQKPSEDWLRHVVSSKARSKIKDVLKEEKKAAALVGKEVVMRKLKQMKIEATETTINHLTEYFEAKTPLNFYYWVGKGKIDAKEIKKFKRVSNNELTKKREQISDATSFEREKTKVKEQETDMLLIGEDMDVIDYQLAKCCNPIPGDDVFGFVTVNEGIKIHRTTCPNAAELMSNYGYRVIKAKWTSQKEIAFLAGLKIIGTDRVGLISDITKIISTELKVNMRSITVDSESGIFEGSIMLFVNDTIHLNLLMEKLRKVNGVVKVNRFDS